jgi:hypothetical protein
MPGEAIGLEGAAAGAAAFGAAFGSALGAGVWAMTAVDIRAMTPASITLFMSVSWFSLLAYVTDRAPHGFRALPAHLTQPCIRASLSAWNFRHYFPFHRIGSLMKGQL